MQLKKSLKILTILLTLSILSFAQTAKTEGRLDLQLTGNDSMHVATATITNAASKIPMKAVEVTFFVKRSFGLMKVGVGKTDTSGIVSVEFPLNIPGSDASRNVIVIAKVEDNDAVNDLVCQATTQSMVSFPPDTPLPRAMISPRAPWWLVITFSLIVGGVWFLFAYVLYLILRIKRAVVIKLY